MSDKLLNVEQLKTYYDTRFGEKIFAVDGVSFDLEEGKVLGIAGESGCGKSTLALSLIGLFAKPLCYDSGAIVIKGRDVTQLDKETRRVEILGKKIAYIPQSAMNALNPTAKIKNFIFDIMKEHFPDMTKEEVFKLAKERFKELNLDERVLHSYPNELSGGMKQRTVIAISTIMNPDILVADEPTSALDVSTQKVVMKMLMSLMEKKIVKSMIFITHELPLLFHIADNIMVMYAGECVEYGTSEDVVFKPLHPYAVELMTSIVVPEVGQKGHKLSSIPGAPPNLKYKMTGCRFAPRCSLATEACTEADVEETVVGHRRYRCVMDRKVKSDV
ncbi:MAG: ABC transporter ATP-binding protein [Clostridiales bacterium]|nr:ABC transporter ATP-binding protein [Clostridiales bacterium]